MGAYIGQTLIKSLYRRPGEEEPFNQLGRLQVIRFLSSFRLHLCRFFFISFFSFPYDRRNGHEMVLYYLQVPISIRDEVAHDLLPPHFRWERPGPD